jgi:WD40 repeat protein
MASVGVDGAVRLNSVESALAQGKSRVLTLRGYSGKANALAYHPRRTQLAVAAGRSVQLWEIGPARREATHLATGARRPVQGLAFGTADRTLASLAGEAVGLWDLESGKAPTLLESSPRHTHDVVWSADGRWLAAAGAEGALVWDAKTRERAWSFPAGRQHALTFSPSGEFIASVGKDGKVIIRNARTGEPILTLGAGANNSRDLAFGPENRLATTTTKGGLTVWEVPSGRVAWTLPAVSEPYRSAFSPDGKSLATAVDLNVQLLNGRTGKPERTLVKEGSRTERLRFSPDGRRLACGTNDGLIRLWEPASGMVVLELEGFGGGSPVVWGPEGRRLAAGEVAPGGVMIWDAPGFDPRRR